MTIVSGDFSLFVELLTCMTADNLTVRSVSLLVVSVPFTFHMQQVDIIQDTSFSKRVSLCEDITFVYFYLVLFANEAQ